MKEIIKTALLIIIQLGLFSAGVFVAYCFWTANHYAGIAVGIFLLAILGMIYFPDKF